MLRKLLWKAVAILLISFIHLKGCWAATRTVIVDDTYGDLETGALPTYVPGNTGWQHCGLVGDSDNCDTIGDQSISLSQTMNGTFSPATWSPNAVSTEGNAYTVEISFGGKYQIFLTIYFFTL